MLGKATLTMVTSIRLMKFAINSAAMANQRPRTGCDALSWVMEIA